MHESFAFTQEMELADTAEPARSSWLGMLRTGLAARLKKWIDNYADAAFTKNYRAYRTRSSSIED